jgi:hypothetical protein
MESPWQSVAIGIDRLGRVWGTAGVFKAPSASELKLLWNQYCTDGRLAERFKAPVLELAPLLGQLGAH